LDFNLQTIEYAVDAVAGQKVLNIYTNLKKSDIPAGTYNLTFWVKGNTTPNVYGKNLTIINTSFSDFNPQNWRLCSYEIIYSYTGELIIGSGITIDEIRLCPEDAQITTYSYDPSFGTISVTNENNITSYFEYDKLGRLIISRDFDKNILQFYQYHYKP
jgi:YD repeat-containing protein